MNLSFRTKLLFCMMIVVVGVTTATIILTQDRVRETYRLLFEEEFTNDLEFAADQQATRLATLKDQSDKLSIDPKVIDALKKGDGLALFRQMAEEAGMQARDSNPLQRFRPGGFGGRGMGNQAGSGGFGNSGSPGGSKGGPSGGQRPLSNQPGGTGPSGRRGDLFVRVRVQLPDQLTDEQRALFEQLRSLTTPSTVNA